MKSALLGRMGEAQAGEYLRRKGYTLLEANYHSRYGEIDLIARKGAVVVMVEVKTRTSDRFAKAMEAVDLRKRQRIRATAMQWLAGQERTPQIRFDVIEVYPEGKIRHIENAFE